jgi:hypothetical protein
MEFAIFLLMIIIGVIIVNVLIDKSDYNNSRRFYEARGGYNTKFKKLVKILEEDYNMDLHRNSGDEFIYKKKIILKKDFEGNLFIKMRLGRNSPICSIYYKSDIGQIFHLDKFRFYKNEVKNDVNNLIEEKIKLLELRVNSQFKNSEKVNLLNIFLSNKT